MCSFEMQMGFEFLFVGNGNGRKEMFYLIHTQHILFKVIWRGLFVGCNNVLKSSILCCVGGFLILNMSNVSTNINNVECLKYKLFIIHN